MNTVDSNQKELLEVCITIDRTLSDIVCDYIIENLSSGLVIEEEDGSWQAGIKLYMPVETDPERLSRLQAYVDDICQREHLARAEIKHKIIKNVAWEEQYRRSVTAVDLPGGIHVRPPWLPADNKARYDIVIEPAMAFGTGRHETTRGCLKVIGEKFEKGMSFLDVGCGSGILSILADLKGASEIVAVDYDELATDNTRKNFVVNNVACEFSVEQSSLEEFEVKHSFDFVCANIIRETIVKNIARLLDFTSRGGILALSGLLKNDENEVVAALAAKGQSDLHTVEDGEWLTIWLKRS